jgi:hypothetical protein
MREGDNTKVVSTLPRASGAVAGQMKEGFNLAVITDIGRPNGTFVND